MQTTAARRAATIAAATIVAFTAACSTEAPVGPARDAALATRPATTRVHNPVEGIGACSKLDVSARAKPAFHAYAIGVQIYRWTGTAWTFVGPEADLFADAGGNGKVGTHYTGPAWESLSGSKVVGSVAERCTPNAAAIPWLLLNAVSNSGPGVFDHVDLIQRVNTVGGLAPNAPGTMVGQLARVPYTAEYFFYRAD